MINEKLNESEHQRYMRLLSEKYPTIADAASEIIRIEAQLRLPKSTEHFMSDLHGENEAFIHILNSCSGVIREKIDVLFRDSVMPADRADLATLIYYPAQKLPELKARETDLHAWYSITLYRLIDLCRLVSSKHTRAHVRKLLPESCRHILDELLHAHFEDHDKELYYSQIVESIIRNGVADLYITQLCQVIKRLAVDRLHIVGDLFDRGPRPDQILDTLMDYGDVDFQWGNHDTVWMGAASGSPVCILTVLKTTLAYNNIDVIETGYGISLRTLDQMAERVYAKDHVSLWRSKDESRGGANWRDCARMHKAVTIMLLKAEAQVINRNPDFMMDGRDFINRIDYVNGTVPVNGKVYPIKDTSFPTVNPENPSEFSAEEQSVLNDLVRGFRESGRLQRHIRFLYSQGSMYTCYNGNLLYHGAMPMTEDGELASERFEGENYSGKRLFDYCDHRARAGYFAAEGSPERLAGQDFLWYLWCGPLSPTYGRSAMTTFERIYIDDPETYVEVKNPYYRCIDNPGTAEMILREFGLENDDSRIINGHVPVRAVEGENPVKGGGKLIIIDGGFCRAYHPTTGIAGYTLVYNSHGLTLRTHQPFESMEKAIREDEDIASRSENIYTAPQRILVRDTDDGRAQSAKIADLRALISAYRNGTIT